MRSVPGTGFARRRGVQFTVYIEDDMHGQLIDMAKREGISLSEAIRTVLEWGLESIGVEDGRA